MATPVLVFSPSEWKKEIKRLQFSTLGTFRGHHPLVVAVNKDGFMVGRGGHSGHGPFEGWICSTKEDFKEYYIQEIEDFKNSILAEEQELINENPDDFAKRTYGRISQQEYIKNTMRKNLDTIKAMDSSLSARENWLQNNYEDEKVIKVY